MDMLLKGKAIDDTGYKLFNSRLGCYTIVDITSSCLISITNVNTKLPNVSSIKKVFDDTC